MKKNILYSLLISTVATVGLSSCDAFLEENPKDQITEEQAYQNSTLLYLNTVASLYTQVGANGGGSGLQGTDRGLYDLNTFTTDEAVLPTRGGDWYDGGLWQDVFLHKWGTKNDLVKGSWDYLYRVIAQANKSLDKLNEILAKDPENTSVPKYISEVRAFRALYYYYLLDMFARVPLVTSSTTAMADVEQSERSVVFTFVKTELEESVADLSDAHSNLPGEYYGRITKPVAYFLMPKFIQTIIGLTVQSPMGKLSSLLWMEQKKMLGKLQLLMVLRLKSWAISWPITLLPTSLRKMKLQ